MEAVLVYYGHLRLAEIRAMGDTIFIETFRAIQYIREQEAKQQNGGI